NDDWNGCQEETNAPNGVAKKSILVGAQSYRAQYGMDAIFLLPANLYGPRDNFDLHTSHVIPALIRKMTDATGEVVLWGDGSPTREFLYVDDAAEGLLLAAERYDGAEPVNLGTGVVAWLAFRTPHNGWVWYSGGDATEYWTSQWAVAHGWIPQAVVGWGLPVAYAWVPFVSGSTLLVGLPVIVLFHALVLLPLSL